MQPKNASFESRKLSLMASAADFQDSREPPLRIGDRVQLNSGGPSSLVVDLDADTVTIGWSGAEAVFPRPCVHRVRD